MNAWIEWTGWSLFYGGLAVSALSIAAYAGERREPGQDRLGTATVFDEAWLVGAASITAGIYLVFDIGAGDMLAMLAAAYLLSFPIKMLLRPRP